MGKGRDKRKKHEDPVKAQKRAERQAAKVKRGEKPENAEDGTNLGGLNNEEDVALTVARLKKVDHKRRNVEEKVLAAAPPPRAHPALLPHPSRDNEVIMFGGEVWDGETTRPFNDLVVFNAQKNQWRQIFSPLGPSPRSSCQGFTYKHYAYIHGGEFVSASQSQYLHFRDLFRFDSKTCVWEEMTGQTEARVKGQQLCPSARSGHRIAVWKRSAVLFGGFYDNALESRYFNDLWVLDDLEGSGSWRQIQPATYSERPDPRSGHVVAMHDDSFFVFGGFVTHKVSRFQRPEASVYHDLWTIDMANPTALWQKVRLTGVPPPIRAGFGCAVRDRKRAYVFGGVVDVDGPGGSTLSTFHNDMFCLHLDSKKFFPAVLRDAAAKKAAVTDDAPKDSLAAEVSALIGGGVEISSDDEDEDEDNSQRPTLTAALLEAPKVAHETLPSGQVLPCKRMNSMMCIKDNTLFIYGGQYEAGKKEITLGDMYTLNLNRMDTYQCHAEHDLSQLKWLGKDSATGSWEDGSTVMDVDELEAQLEEEAAAEARGEYDEEEPVHVTVVSKDGPAPQRGILKHTDPVAPVVADDDEDDEDVEGGAFAARIAEANAHAGGGVDRRTNVRGKAGLQRHKEFLQSQLTSANSVPTPLEGEKAKAFFKRTAEFWLRNATEALADGGAVSKQELRRTAECFANQRHEEAAVLVEQLRNIEEQQVREKEALREHFAERRRLRDAQEAAEAAADDEDPPAAVPVVDGE